MLEQFGLCLNSRFDLLWRTCFTPPIIPFFALIILCVLRPLLSPRQPRLSARVCIGACFPQGYSFSCRGKPSYSVAMGLDHRETMAAIKSTGCCLFLAQAITAVSFLLNSSEALDLWSPVICSALRMQVLGLFFITGDHGQKAEVFSNTHKSGYLLHWA